MQELKEESFKDFVTRILGIAINPELLKYLVMDEPLEYYFRSAFTHKTFMTDVASKEGIMDYEILEKIGDRVLGATFQLYLFEIMGNEVKIPQIYADMEKLFVSETELNGLVDMLGFKKHIRIAKDTPIEGKIPSDVFEAFIAAIILSADRFIPQAKSIGFALAKDWLYQVFNTYYRDRIDPTKATDLIDYRTRVNEVWLFNGWGKAIYKSIGKPGGAGLVGKASSNLVGPNHYTFPEALRGQIIGTGYGNDKKEAGENAAKAGLEKLKVDFPDLKNNEVEFDDLELARLQKLLLGKPDLAARVLGLLKDKTRFLSISLRKTRIYGYFYVQLRVKTAQGIWRNDVRVRSEVSEDLAIIDAFERFVTNASRK